MNSQKIKKRVELNAEEQRFEQEIVAGDWQEASTSLKNEVVAATREKTKKKREARVNIRVTPETLELMQTLAEQEGVGYLTLMGSVLHKYAHGRLISTEDVKKVVSSLGLNKSKF